MNSAIKVNASSDYFFCIKLDKTVIEAQANEIEAQTNKVLSETQPDGDVYYEECLACALSRLGYDFELISELSAPDFEITIAV